MPVEILGQGSLQEVDLAAAAGETVAPVQVPDTRVTISRTPRSNRIFPGPGWEIPSDDRGHAPPHGWQLS
jgi:hypothetical protein